MSIVKRQNSKNFFSEFVLNGKHYIKSTKTTNRTIASKIDQQYYNEAVEENALGGDRITLKEAMELYLQSKRANPQRQKVIGYFIEWINKNRDTSIKLHDVDTKWLHNFVNIRLDLGLKPSSVRINLLTITGTINHCKKLGYNVCPKLEMPTFNVKNEKTRVLTVEEEEKLFNELLPRKGRGSGPQKHLAQRSCIHSVSFFPKRLVATMKSLSLNGVKLIWRIKCFKSGARKPQVPVFYPYQTEFMIC